MKERLRKTIQEMVAHQEVAGISVWIEKGGQEVCFLTEGMADIQNKRPLRRDSMFRLYSMTKPVCAAAAMILLERGELDLFTPVSRFLPGFEHQQVWENGQLRPVKRQVMVQDLLQMTSGLSYPNQEDEAGRQTAAVFEEAEARLYGAAPMTTFELANAIGQCGLAFEPGTSWRYSASADVLGAVIEAASGMSLGNFLEQEMFAPLGMKDTAFWVPEEKQDRLARTYEWVKDGCGLVEYTGDYLGIQNRMKRKPAFESGGAGLVSTLEDYMRFARMLRFGGQLDGVRILQERTVEYFTNGRLLALPQRAFERDRGDLGGHTYGNLMTVCKAPGQATMLARAGEYGWDGALGTYFSNFPEEDMTILVGMQKSDDRKWEMIRKLRNIIMSRI